jgi:hypothetical protein
MNWIGDEYIDEPWPIIEENLLWELVIAPITAALFMAGLVGIVWLCL